MDKLAHADLMKLEDYARERDAFRRRIMAHKRARRIAVGPHLTLIFEDRLTIQYQVQEMLRVERIFEPDLIDEELETYNPLIPDGANWKATAMIEYPDEAERRQKLRVLKGLEHEIWVRVGDGRRVPAIADEDLERENEEKTSAVHFLRFELAPDAVAATKAGAPIEIGVDHPHYTHAARLSDDSRAALVSDLD